MLVRFPFSDLSEFKLPPALVLADAGRDDWILCQITSKPYRDARAISITDGSFSGGGLPLTSYARESSSSATRFSLFVRSGRSGPKL